MNLHFTVTELMSRFSKKYAVSFPSKHACDIEEGGLVPQIICDYLHPSYKNGGTAQAYYKVALSPPKAHGNIIMFVCRAFADDAENEITCNTEKDSGSRRLHHRTSGNFTALSLKEALAQINLFQVCLLQCFLVV